MSSHLLDNQLTAFSNGQAERTHDQGPSFENEPPASELPVNFAEVTKGIYRSAFPQERNLSAMERLGLKTIVTLVEEPYSPDHQAFLQEGGITHHRILVHPNKDPAVKTPDAVVIRILQILVTRSNHPVLVHCNKGKHRTGSVIGCLRKLQGWDLDSIIAEYISFSHPKPRILDEKFIEAFDISKLAHLRHALMSPLPWNIPSTPRLVPVEDTKELSPPTWYLHSSPMNRVDVDVS